MFEERCLKRRYLTLDFYVLKGVQNYTDISHKLKNQGTAPYDADMKSAHSMGYADLMSVFRGPVR